LLLLPLGFFSVMVAVRAHDLLTLGNLLASTGLLLLLTHLWGGGAWPEGLFGPLTRALRVLGNTLIRPLGLLGAVLDGAAMTAFGRARALPVVRGLALAAPLLLLFGGLLASADSDFAGATFDLLWALPAWAGGKLTALLASAGLGLVAAGWLAHGQRRHEIDDPAPESVEGDLPGAASGPLGLTEGLTVLGSVAGLFAAFLGFQAMKLAQVAVREWAPGFTYSAYARRGFFELTVVALLAILLVLGLRRLIRRTDRSQETLFRSGASLLLLEVLGLVALAARRLSIYEETYGATVLRVVSHLFIVVVGAVAVWRVVTLWRGGERAFARGCAALALTYLAVLNVLNPAAFAAREHLAHPDRLVGIDGTFLGSLGPDALPVVLGHPNAQALHVLHAVRDASPQFASSLRPWYAFHLAHWRAERALQGTAVAGD
jgi:hypothetical protein